MSSLPRWLWVFPLALAYFFIYYLITYLAPHIPAHEALVKYMLVASLLSIGSAGAMVIIYYLTPARYFWSQIERTAPIDWTIFLMWWIVYYTVLMTREPLAIVAGGIMMELATRIVYRPEARKPFWYSVAHGAVIGFEAFYISIAIYMFMQVSPKMSYVFTIADVSKIEDMTRSLLSLFIPREMVEVYVGIATTFFTTMFYTACEEFMFRRCLNIYARFGMPLVIFVTTLLFMLAHVPTRLSLPPDEFAIAMSSIGVATGCMVYAYIHTGHIAAPIVAHTVYNVMMYHQILHPLTYVYVLPLLAISIIIYLVVRRLHV